MTKQKQKTLKAKQLDRVKEDLRGAVKPPAVNGPFGSLHSRQIRPSGSPACARIACALAENPLFQQRLSRLIQSTVNAVKKLLGDAESQPRRGASAKQLASQERSRSRLDSEKAFQMVRQLLDFLRQSTTQVIAAGLIKDRAGFLKLDAATEQRQLLQKRKEGFRDERDTSLYPLVPFSRNDVLRKWN